MPSKPDAIKYLASLPENPRPYKTETLSTSAQERLQNTGDRAMEVLSQHLGIPLESMQVFQAMLYQLNDQNTGRDNPDRDQGGYREVRQRIIEPQMKTLESFVLEWLHPTEWSVKVKHGPLVGDMTHISIESKTRDLNFSIFERGLEIDSPELEIVWNNFPSRRPPYLRSYDTNITAFQRGNALSLAAPAVKIQSNATVFGEDVLQLMHTDFGREGVKPTINEIITPKRVLTRATYNEQGKLQCLSLLFSPPDLKRSSGNAILVFYDFRKDQPSSHPFPTQVRNQRFQEQLTLPAYPEILVEGDSLKISYLGVSDSFPLEVGEVEETAQTILKGIKRNFPPKNHFFALPFGQA